MLVQNAVIRSFSPLNSFFRMNSYFISCYGQLTLFDAPHVAIVFLSVVNCDAFVSDGGSSKW